MIRLLPRMGDGMGHHEITLRSEKNTMNTKTKMMLGLSVLTAGTLAAGATGTFAWFTTNKTAKATYSKVVAQADTQKIKVVLGGITDTGIKEVSNVDDDGNYLEAATSSTSASSYTGDISSADGLTFKKPIWAAQAGNDQPVTNVRDAKVSEFTQYYVGITNTGNQTSKIFLNQNTAISALDSSKSADTALAKWTRVAVVEVNEKPTEIVTKGTLKVLFEQEDTDKTTTSAKDSYVVGVKTDDGTKLDIGSVENATHHKGDFNTVTAATTTSGNNAYLGEFAKGATKYYAISVWMEGTESNNQDAAVGGEISVTLGFTGIE